MMGKGGNWDLRDVSELGLGVICDIRINLLTFNYLAMIENNTGILFWHSFIVFYVLYMPKKG